MPSAIGIAITSANSDTKIVTWIRSKMPKVIFDVSVVIQLPP